MAHNYHLPYAAVFPENNEVKNSVQPIIFLHGYSSNMVSRADLVSFLDTQNYCYFFVNAPNRLPGESDLPAFRWYEYQDDDYQDELLQSTEKLELTIDYICNTYNFRSEEIILAGFSQGGMMAIHVVLNGQRVFKSVAGFSVLIESEPAIFRSPIKFFISQGLNDPIFSPQSGQYTRDTLEHAGHTVLYKEYDMAHEINMECLADFSNWVTTL